MVLGGHTTIDGEEVDIAKQRPILTEGQRNPKEGPMVVLGIEQTLSTLPVC